MGWSQSINVKVKIGRGKSLKEGWAKKRHCKKCPKKQSHIVSVWGKENQECSAPCLPLKCLLGANPHSWPSVLNPFGFKYICFFFFVFLMFHESWLDFKNTFYSIINHSTKKWVIYYLSTRLPFNCCFKFLEHANDCNFWLTDMAVYEHFDSYG